MIGCASGVVIWDDNAAVETAPCESGFGEHNATRSCCCCCEVVVDDKQQLCEQVKCFWWESCLESDHEVTEQAERLVTAVMSNGCGSVVPQEAGAMCKHPSVDNGM